MEQRVSSEDTRPVAQLVLVDDGSVVVVHGIHISFWSVHINQIVDVVDPVFGMPLRHGPSVLLMERHMECELHLLAADDGVGNEGHIFLVEPIVSVVAHHACDAFSLLVEHVDVERCPIVEEAVDGVGIDNLYDGAVLHLPHRACNAIAFSRIHFILQHRLLSLHGHGGIDLAM